MLIKGLILSIFLCVLVNISNCQSNNEEIYDDRSYLNSQPAFSHNENIRIENDFEKLLHMLQKEEQNEQELPQDDEFIPVKSKKSKNNRLEESEETAPLADHVRKNKEHLSDQLESLSVRDVCKKNMNIQPKRIIDSKISVSNGAKFLGIEKIPLEIGSKLSELQDACVDLCCANENCDSSLLSLKDGNEGYRCYLFKCQDHCTFVSHEGYVVMTQVSINQNKKKNDQKVITGERKDPTKCHKQYEFSCVSNGKCIPIYDVCDNIDHCDDKSDEMNCKTTTNSQTTSTRASQTTTAVLTTAKTIQDEEVSKKKNRKKKPETKIENDYVNDNDEEPADDLSSIIETDDSEPSDAYVLEDEDYDQLKLLKQQNEIIDHLRELEEADYREQKKPKNNIVFETPKDFLDSFVKEALNEISNKEPKPDYDDWQVESTTTKRATPKIKFHDDHIIEMNSETFMNSISTKKPDMGNKIRFVDKEPVDSYSPALPIVLLILGIGIVSSFFVYLLLNTKYVSRRMKWFVKNSDKQSVDVDGDYLINGMYL